MASGTVLVRVTRSGLEESVHLGHVAVCDVGGRLVAWAGDPHRPVFARSSMKPVQAAVSLGAIGGGIAGDLVAVMCASHNGEPVHVAAVRRLLREVGLGLSALRNPPGWPLDPRSMARAGRARRVLHNCSGKHAGMLAACERQGWDGEGYRSADHPLQRRVSRAVRGLTGIDDLAIGVDGCGVPVHGMPLLGMATLYARLGRPQPFGALGRRIAECSAAMRAHPYLVAGRSRTDTAVMERSAGLIVKSGAEGLACAAVPEAGLGVAVKAADGGERASGPALIRALALIGALTHAELGDLEGFARRPVTGGGAPVGEVVAEFRLRRVQRDA
ncbi:MAG TPA: asparaginase [Actinomycetota bacterium]|jgi:L-asparaginase II|nr:asparaginase [Actinomycetota bacterium]